uniref:Gustatory receptor n=1 Tax=Anoplophora chinensis TaxID=217632 RepID=A0A2H4ZBB8_ANOCN|nr:gustatory receptor [Anoplophora chinensis]
MMPAREIKVDLLISKKPAAVNLGLSSLIISFKFSSSFNS